MIQPKKAAGLLQDIGAKNSPDTVLAHITPEEAALLKARGGSGRRDKVTGLLHFEDDSSSDSTGGDSSYSGSYGGFSGSGWGDDSGDAYSTSGNSDGYSNVGGWGGSSGDAYGLSPYGSNGQSYEPMFPAEYKTLGGSLLNAFGGDPQGTWANVADFGINALGAFNPMIGAATKIGKYAVRNSPSDMATPMLAKQDQTSMLDGLLSTNSIGGALKSVVSSFGNPSVSTAAANAAASGSLPASMPGSSGTSANDLWLLKQRGLLSGDALQSNRTMT